MGEPGKGDPGMGDDPEPPDTPNEAGVPMTRRRGFGSDLALEKALKAAFAGVDFAELEAAWRDAMR